MSAKLRLLSAMIGVGAILLSVGASAASRQYIYVTSSKEARYKYSVYADLYDGKGNRVYHWQEKGKKPGSSLRWNYTDGGDGGWLHIWIDPSPAQRASFLTLPLGRNHCYEITSPVIGSISMVRKKTC
ncbi:hypothetical protein Bresa_00069|uniref:Uncharacterized protein n=1 Tax=Brenneria salicis ATCC 15712 = DSM 30166 TaxID=714314 RepID=A0A366I696_9GAMM|nr:hypothetical protein [Brenneria salicis]NMN90038.1 hypothetical protein [Brenneria salicis ATCC 15712 = DSM 30166]RBP64313.1 hypothetical protein DES54_1088 [Brenneria salicis ATCC 15712 = DSM 30166]